MELGFPIKGINKGSAASKQPPLTSPIMNNVRVQETQTGRYRGGQRPGLDKWGAGTQIGGSEQPVVAICSVSSVI